MATERIQIIVSERGSRVVRRNVRGIGEDASFADRNVQLLRRALLALGGFQVIRSLIRTADAFTVIENRLAIATGGVENVANAFDRLTMVSNETRTPLEANVRLFNQISLASSELGATQEQLFRFTEITGRALAVQGVSAEEARGSLLQLSQGLGEGIIRAQEFNSLIENLRPLLQVAADGIDRAGGSISELRRIVIAGELTSREFFEAILEGGQALDDLFSLTTVTVGQAFTVLRNNFIGYVGEVNQALGGTEALTQGILLAANNFDTLSQGVQATSIFLGVNFAAQAVPRATAALNTLRLAIIANPFGALAVAGTAVISILVGFRDSIRLSSDSLTTFNDLLRGTRAFISELFEDIRPAFEELQTEVGNLSQEILGFVPSLLDVIRFLAEFGDQGIRIFTRLRVLGSAAFETLFAIVPIGFQTIVNAGGQSIERLLDLFTAFGAGVASGFSAIDRIASLTFQNIGIAARAALEGNLQGVLDAASRNARLASNAGGIFANAFGNGFSEGLEEAGQNQIIPRLELIRDEVLNSILARAQEGIAASEALTPFVDSLDRILELTEEIRGARVEEIVTEQATENVETAVDELTRGEAVLRGFSDGFGAVFENFTSLENLSLQAASLIEDAFRSAEEVFVEFTQTGRLEFEDLIRVIQEQLARLAFREALGGIFGAAGGASGPLSFLGGLLGGGRSLAGGGPFERGDLVAVGGRDPELAVATRPGQVFNADQLSGMMQPAAPMRMPAPQVNVSVINVSSMDEAQAAASARTGQGDRVFINTLTQNRSSAREVLGIA